MSLQGKHVAILGIGRSGRAAASLALREGASVSAWDQVGPSAFIGLAKEVEVHAFTDAAAGEQCVCDLLIVSPGIDTYGPLVAAFSKQAGQVIGEVEFAARYYHGKIIGITGTNGKTTTTDIVSKILSHAGLGGPACGNYGVPLAEIVMQPNHPEAIALELSSFQLETIHQLRPDVAVWLNFAADHMDRYTSLEIYRAAKMRIFENQSEADVAIVRKGENLPQPKARVIEFSTEHASTFWFSDGHTIYRDGNAWMNMEQHTHLRGMHNAENAMAACAACEMLGIPAATIGQALLGYSPLAHRCELIRTLDGVEYLNDSKATNLHALESALRSQTKPVVLIAGGKDKGLDYRELVPLLQSKVIAAVTFGQIARPLAEVFRSATACDAVSTLADAVPLARSLAPSGATVLLSPGTSSFDQFSGYEQRGNHFRDLVNQLI
ncbi:MAG: UDP-N-acetylmuramoyl-L-alanine--D-glutamate ligase [Verrucomicrobia bacterium]|nr:MAG: UDP-N-acetylmuramoyl-L-alanine--D-glutamate ligase [Verrucomicrobiota bacterium]